MQAHLIDSVARTTAHRDRDELDIAVAKMLFEHLDPERVSVYRLLGEKGDARVQLRVAFTGTGRSGPDRRDLDRLPRLAERSHWHECALLGDVVHYTPPAQPEDDRLCTVFPLRGDAGVSGLVEIEFSGFRSSLTPQDTRLVHGVLNILHNHLVALDYGERDTLTGLLNRRTFDAGFDKLRGRGGETGSQGGRRSGGSEQASNWLAVIDIDRFKSINDSHGHLFGDEVLLLVSRLMNESCRCTDQLYRFGGEEFVVVLDRVGETGAEVAFERLRTSIENYRFPQVGQVTVSIGYTCILPEDVPASAVERADSALYYAKNSGRNRVLCYEQLVQAGMMTPKQSRAEVELF